MGLHKFNTNHEQRKLWFKQNKNKITKIATITISVIVFVVGVILLTKADFTKLIDLDFISTKAGNICEYEVGHVFEFDYTGDSQEFNVPCNGTYKLETWGAQGGSYNSNNDTIEVGGYGGYSTGTISLKYNDNIYVIVGEEGNEGGYTSAEEEKHPITAYPNGGGVYLLKATPYMKFSSGGGSTHIARTNNLIKDINPSSGNLLIVSGGGGGIADWWGAGDNGGSGGGKVGSTTSFNYSNVNPTGGTQNSGGLGGGNTGGYSGPNEGLSGAYGQGGGSTTYNPEYVSGGGGGGYYGGGASWGGSGAGGSGYIANENLSNKKMVCYNCEQDLVNESTYTESNTCHNFNPTPECSKEGNGYARITLLSTTDEVITPEVELYDGMVPVTYDSNGNTLVADTSTEWYSYGGHKWANAVLVSNTSTYLDSNNNVLTNKKGTVIPTSDILQYYVWIPRFKYKLFNANNGSVDEQMIEIKFQNKDNTKFNGNQNGQWLTHPAFTFGDTELNGFWVAKFEPSVSTGTLSCTDENCDVSSLRVLPNKYSLTSMTVGNQFYASRSIENYFNLSSNQVDSHMMKNMEWGAVEYLAASKYGLYFGIDTCTNSDDNITVTLSNSKTVNRCHIWINNVNTASAGGYGPSVTGCSSKTSANDSIANATTSCGTGYEWNGSINKGRSSTTGNLYGIYDMSGGTWEYAMGNVATGTSTYTYKVGLSGLTSIEEKYYDTYVNPENTTTAHYNGKLGDGTKEILKTYGSNSGGWFSDFAYFPENSMVWFLRGSYYNYASGSGLFAYARNTGGAFNDYSFRPVITKD